jgi:hypothetical protein
MSIAIQVALAVAIVIFTAYAAGRVHQWYRHGFEREVAYREGYNEASHALFHLAIRTLPGTSSPDAGAAPTSLNELPTATTRRHHTGVR